MFPLGSVLLPGENLPLRIFEPRYRRMIQECLAGTPRFGVVLIERGHEVGGGDTRGHVATVAEITRSRALPDGRYVIDCVGTDRIRVTDWLDDDPYPRARVTPWPDEHDHAAANIAPVAESIARLLAVLADIARSRGVPEPALPPLHGVESDGVAAALYRTAASLPLGPSDRLAVLAAPGVAARVDTLARAIDDLTAVAEFNRLPPD